MFEKVNLIPFLQHAKIPFLDCEVTADTSRSIEEYVVQCSEGVARIIIGFADYILPHNTIILDYTDPVGNLAGFLRLLAISRGESPVQFIRAEKARIMLAKLRHHPSVCRN